MAANLSSTPWTDAEDATLLAMRRRGANDVAIGAALNRSAQSIQSRASKLRRSGMMPVPALRFGTDEEIRNLLDMRAAGASTAVIGAALGRSHWAITTKVTELIADGTLPGASSGVDRDHVRRIPPARPVARRAPCGTCSEVGMTWTRDQDATALAMARLLVDSRTIGKAVGHSAQSVRLRLMTLRDRQARERAREEHRRD